MIKRWPPYVRDRRTVRSQSTAGVLVRADPRIMKHACADSGSRLARSLQRLKPVGGSHTTDVEEAPPGTSSRLGDCTVWRISKMSCGGDDHPPSARDNFSLNPNSGIGTNPVIDSTVETTGRITAHPRTRACGVKVYLGECHGGAHSTSRVEPSVRPRRAVRSGFVRIPRQTERQGIQRQGISTACPDRDSTRCWRLHRPPELHPRCCRGQPRCTAVARERRRSGGLGSKVWQ